MKTIITILSLLFAVDVLAQPPYFIDFSTLSTNTHVSVWTMVVTNSPRNTNGIVLSNTNFVDVGEPSASAWGKANSNFTYFAQLVASQTPWASDINAAGHNLTNGNTIALATNDLYNASVETNWVTLSSERSGGGIGGVNLGFNNGQIFGEFYDATLGGAFNDIEQFGTGSMIVGGVSNLIGVGSSGPNLYNYSSILGGFQNQVKSGNLSTVGGWMAQSRGDSIWMWSDFEPLSGAFLSASGLTNAFLIRAMNGVGINTNTASGFASQISGNLNVSGSIYINGVLFSGGANYTNNNGNAGVILGSGIGTNFPVMNANQATNDPFGNPLASLLASTNAAAEFQISNVANMFGLATNLSVFTYVTNVLSVTYVTNEDNVIATYTAVIQTILQNPNTNTFTLYDAGTVAANGTYTWVPSVAAYTNTAAQFGCRLTGGFYTVFNNVGATLYSAFPGSVFLGTIFPSVWGNDGGVNPSPLGYFQTTSGPGITFTNTYRVIVTTAQTVDTGNNQFALSVNQKMTASGYYFNNVTLQSVFQGMMFPYLFVTNCAGTATNFQGPFGNTWLGFYTNTANGTLLIPSGYVGSSIDGTNFSTSISLLCSNLTSLRQNISYYSNTNVTGLYSVNFGHDAMATNQPLVSLYTPPLTGVTTNLQFIDANVVGGILIGSRTNTLYFTNGLLMNVTQP